MKTAIYREEDWEAEVEILQDNSDEVWERYTLRTIRTLRESEIYKPTPDGTVFEVDKRRDVGAMGAALWQLQRIPEKEDIP